MRNMTEEQRRILDAAGVPKQARDWISVYGWTEHEIAMGVWNWLRSNYWPELTHTPRGFELRVWAIPGLVAWHTVEDGLPIPVMLHAGHIAQERPEGPPIFEVCVTCDEPHAETRLAAAVWRWGVTKQGWGS